jgi:hypothetical protein
MKTFTINDGSNPWNLTTVINPQRYVWHITYRSIQKSFRAIPGDFTLREKIRKEGLIYKKDWAVFAHNGLVKPEFIFPFCIDHFSFGDSVKTVMNTMTSYDFWRIDTLFLNAEWFIDPLMSSDIDNRYPKMKKDMFICTQQNIPPTALKLFTFKEEHLDEIGKLKLNHYDGVTSVNFKKWTDNLVKHVWENQQENTLENTKPLEKAA